MAAVTNAQKANEKIALLLAEATAKLERAGQLADTWGINFAWTPPTESGTFTYAHGWDASDDCSWETSGEAGTWDFEPDEDE